MISIVKGRSLSYIKIIVCQTKIVIIIIIIIIIII